MTTAYAYDGDGRRVQKVTGGTTTVYVYDAAGQLAAEYATQPAPMPCTTCYLTADHLGSTRMVTDGNANVQSFADYLPFGEEIRSGVGSRSALYYPPSELAVADGVTQKFTGKERDAETGLDYFGARYLSAAQGRFTTPDWSAKPEPVPYAKLDDPQTLNLYAYVRNNSLRLTDPDGHGILDWLVQVFGKPPDPPPPPPPLSVTPHAFESAHVNKLTVRQVANVVANENHDVTPGKSSPAVLQEAKTAQAAAVMNGDKKFGDLREQRAHTAPTAVSPQMADSPQYGQALEAASTAFQQQSLGTDPTGGRVFFNNRFNEDRGPRNLGGQRLPVFRRYGPFDYSGGPVFTLIYENPK